MVERVEQASSNGLPPRGRGNPSQEYFACHFTRSTPAWAGQPPERQRRRSRAAVYPRVGGATAAVASRSSQFFGLPPRGRGNQCQCAPRRRPGRSTPAWAGQPAAHGLAAYLVGVYPRVGGATATRRSVTSACAGLPPRGRGNHEAVSVDLSQRGSTPAWAGQPGGIELSQRSKGWVYPRVGGATGSVPQAQVASCRVYPRVGGATPSHRPNRLPVVPGSTPAWAGQPLSRCGDTAESIGLPPRGRGNHAPSVNVSTMRRSTPAWAGQPAV